MVFWRSSIQEFLLLPFPQFILVMWSATIPPAADRRFFFYFFRRARKSADYNKSEKRSFSSRLQQKGKEHRLIGCYLCSLSTRSVAWRYKNNGVVEYQFHGWSVINSLRRAGSTSRCVLFFKYHDQFSSFSINRGRVDVREMVWYFGCEASKLFHQRSCIPQRLHF